MSRSLPARLRIPLVGGGLLLWEAAAHAEYALNMTPGVTPVSRQVYELHMLIFWICVAIGVGVFGVMFWSIYHHRKSRGAVASQFHESTTVEVVWTVVPMLILIGMAIPATKTLVAMEDTRDPELTITVTGYQWKWKYDYLDEGISFFSNLSTPREQILNRQDKNQAYLLEVDNPMVVPVGKKIRILTTSADVIHSWWMPDLGWKRDAIPGFINENWALIEKPGIYRGQCAELCGKDHAYMPIVVEAVSEQEYRQWVADQQQLASRETGAADRQWSREELISKGQQVYNSTCVACHQAQGQGVPGVFPSLVGSPLITGELDAHIDIILNGKAGTAMAAFRDQLSDADIAAVVTYERNAWGNDTGDIVQPATVAAQR